MICCSFCGKSEDQVFCIVKGPTVFICDECVEICVQVIKEKVAATTDTGAT